MDDVLQLWQEAAKKEPDDTDVQQSGQKFFVVPMKEMAGLGK